MIEIQLKSTNNNSNGINKSNNNGNDDDNDSVNHDGDSPPGLSSKLIESMTGPKNKEQPMFCDHHCGLYYKQATHTTYPYVKAGWQDSNPGRLTCSSCVLLTA